MTIWRTIIVLAIGCQLSAVSQTFSRVPPPSPASLAQRMAVRAAVVQPPATNHGYAVSLAWIAPTNAAISGFRVFASTNKTIWRQVAQVGRTNFAAVTNIFLPQWFVARAFNATIEGPDSNAAGVLGIDSVVRVEAQNATNQAGPWATLATIYERTNSPEPQMFFRNAITSRKQFRVE